MYKIYLFLVTLYLTVLIISQSSMSSKIGDDLFMLTSFLKLTALTNWNYILSTNLHRFKPQNPQDAVYEQVVQCGSARVFLTVT